MIDLAHHEHEALRDLVRAGTEGQALADVGLAVALRLQLAGLASIQTTTPQRVHATRQGVAFSRRTAFA